RPNGKVREHEIPHIVHDVVFVATGVGVDEETTRGRPARLALEAAVGGGNDQRRQLAPQDRALEMRGYVVEKRLLILREAVHPHQKRVLLIRVETRRQVNVQVTLLTQRV